MTFLARQTVGAAQAVFELQAAQTPSAIFDVHQRFLMETWARGSAHAFKLAALSSSVSAQVLAPVHSAATANAKRLTKKARKPDEPALLALRQQDACIQSRNVRPIGLVETDKAGPASYGRAGQRITGNATWVV